MMGKSRGRREEERGVNTCESTIAVLKCTQVAEN